MAVGLQQVESDAQKVAVRIWTAAGGRHGGHDTNRKENTKGDGSCYLYSFPRALSITPPARHPLLSVSTLPLETLCHSIKPKNRQMRENRQLDANLGSLELAELQSGQRLKCITFRLGFFFKSVSYALKLDGSTSLTSKYITQ